MSFNWNEYYNLASDLIKLNTEASFRSSISRGYYAIYNVLRIQAGYRNRKGELTHSSFIEEFKNTSDRILDNFPEISEDDMVFIGNQLDDLRKERNKADYDGAEVFDKNDAVNAYDKVELIFEILEQEE